MCFGKYNPGPSMEVIVELREDVMRLTIALLTVQVLLPTSTTAAQGARELRIDMRSSTAPALESCR
jgi:hypothetical protein